MRERFNGGTSPSDDDAESGLSLGAGYVQSGGYAGGKPRSGLFLFLSPHRWRPGGTARKAQFALGSVAKQLESGKAGETYQWAWPTVGPSGPNCVARLWSLLAECPDKGISAETSSLIFVTDDELRENVRQDVSSFQEAFNNGEWKAATVLAASAIEALLLYVGCQTLRCRTQGGFDQIEITKRRAHKARRMGSRSLHRGSSTSR